MGHGVSGMNRIDRLTGTILLLQSGQAVTAARIAEHWEVSERTVYRDLAALAEAGVPLHYVPGRGYALMPGFHLPPVQFTDQEAAALFTGGEIMERLGDRGLRESLRAALVKVGSVLPEERRAYLARLHGSLGVWLSGSPEHNAAAEFLPIQDAILRRRCMHLRYNAGDSGVVSERTVEPLGLLYYAARWHLLAYCRLRQDLRDFRLDRVVALNVLEETYSGHEGFSVDSFLDDALAETGAIPVTVAMDAALRDRFRREMLGTPTGEEALPDGRIRMNLLAYSLEHFATWLLGFGAGLRVESPPELRRAVGRAAQRIAGLYPCE